MLMELLICECESKSFFIDKIIVTNSSEYSRLEVLGTEGIMKIDGKLTEKFENAKEGQMRVGELTEFGPSLPGPDCTCFNTTSSLSAISEFFFLGSYFTYLSKLPFASCLVKLSKAIVPSHLCYIPRVF